MNDAGYSVEYFALLILRLPHHLQNGAIELRQLIQAEEMVPLQQPHSQSQSFQKDPSMYYKAIHNHKVTQQKCISQAAQVKNTSNLAAIVK